MFNIFLNRPPFLIRIIALMMVLAVFLQTGVVTATQVECFSSGKQSVYLENDKLCCVHISTANPSFKAKCCDVEQQEKVFLQVNHQKDSDAEFDLIDSFEGIFGNILFKSSTWLEGGFLDLPPPFPLRIPLRFLNCVYRI